MRFDTREAGARECHVGLRPTHGLPVPIRQILLVLHLLIFAMGIATGRRSTEASRFVTVRSKMPVATDTKIEL